MGLLYSTYSGNSWQEDAHYEQLTSNKYAAVKKMKFNPASHELIAIQVNTVMYRSSLSSSWVYIITPSGLPSDFEYSKINTNKVIFGGNDDVLRIYDLSTSTWSSVTALSPNTGDILGANGIT